MRRIILFLLLAPLFSRGLAAAAEPETAQKAPRAARAAPKSERTRLVVDHFQGDNQGNKRVRSEVTRVLDEEKSVDLVSVELLDAHRAHDVGFDGSAEGYVEVAKRIGVDALIRGRVLKNEGSRVLTLVVLDGSDGRRLGRIEFKAETLKELRERVAQQLWKELAPILADAGAEPEAKAAPPEPETPEADEPREKAPAATAKPRPAKLPEAKREPEPAPRGPPPRPRRTCPWLEMGAAGGVITRSFAYENERSGALRSYKLERAADAALELGIYPLAFERCNFASGLGMNLGFEPMLPVESHVADQELETRSTASHAELVFRILLGPVSIEPGFGYARRVFTVQRSYVPDVLYQALRPRLKLALRLGPVVAEAGAGGRFVLGAGQLASEAWFPQASGLGFDAFGALGLAPTRWLDILLSAHVERYRFDLNPPEETPGTVGPPAHPNGVADAAHDDFLGFTLGVRVNLSRRSSP